VLGDSGKCLRSTSGEPRVIARSAALTCSNHLRTDSSNEPSQPATATPSDTAIISASTLIVLRPRSRCT
jgi:hypothetical protein